MHNNGSRATSYMQKQWECYEDWANDFTLYCSKKTASGAEVGKTDYEPLHHSTV